MKTYTKILVGIISTIWISTGFAATNTAAFQVTATVTNDCTINASNLAFGNYSHLTVGSTDATSTISGVCTVGALYAITLNDGSNAIGSQKRMKDPGVNYLNYALYTDAGHLTAWSGITSVGGTATGAYSHTVYGSIPAGQNVPAGGYSDTVVATITFTP